MLGAIVVSLALTHAAAGVPPTVSAALTQQPPASATQATPEQPWPPAGVVRPGTGITPPRLIKETKPRYSENARRAQIEGVVVMEAVVGTNGKISDVRVVRSLDTEYGLDDEAVKTVRTWQFSAGKKNGVAVPVLVDIELTFTLLRK